MKQKDKLKDCKEQLKEVVRSHQEFAKSIQNFKPKPINYKNNQGKDGLQRRRGIVIDPA